MATVLVGPVMLSVLYSMGNVLIICALAVLMVRRRVLTAEATKSLGALVFNLFLPCLLFCQLGDGISLDSLHHLWFLPAAAVVTIGLGFGIGALLTRFVTPPRSPETRRIIMGATAFCNSGNLPLVILAALAKTSPYLANDPGAVGRAFQAVFLYTFGWNICFLGAGDRYMFGRGEPPARAAAPPAAAPADADGSASDAEAEPAAPPAAAVPLRAAPGGGGRKYVPMHHEHESDPEAGTALGRPGYRAAGAGADARRAPSAHIPPPPPALRRVGRSPVPSPPSRPSPLALAREFLSPPMTAMLLAVVVGLATPIKRLIFGPTAPLRGLFAAVDLVGNATVPSGTIVLAATLAHSMRRAPAPAPAPVTEGKEPGEGGEETAGYDRRTIGCVVFARLVLSPLVGLGLWAAARACHLIPPDPVVDLVLLIETAMPTAQNIGLFAIVRGSKEAAAIGKLLLVEYLISIATITVALAVFQLIVFA
eukprot:tig00021374_g21097.t1